MNSPGDTLAPMAPDERIDALDVVRGFALFGIFAMNMEFFARPLQDIAAPGIDPAATGLDRIAEFLVFFFVQSKFWTLFSLLFGMGFAMMIERARRAGRPFVPAYLRRTLALLAIGTVHSLLVWSGDILITYALAALFLLGMRGLRHAIVGRHFHPVPPMPPERLAAWGLASYVLPLLLAIGIGAINSALPAGKHDELAAKETAGVRADMEQARERAATVYSSGTWREAVAQRGIDTVEQSLGGLGGFLPFVLGVFVLGMAILRAGIMDAPHEHRGLLRGVRNVGLPLGFAIMALSTWLGTGMGFGKFGLSEGVQVATYLGAGLLLALAYGATVLLALDGPAGGWLRRWLAPAGRMALSNYLLQSVFGTLLFYNYGLGMWGRIGRAEGLAYALVFFALQLLLSRWWLARFQYGPVEWVWRALTYLRLPAMRRAA